MVGSDFSTALIALAAILAFVALRWNSRPVRGLRRVFGRIVLWLARSLRPPAKPVDFSPHAIVRVRVVDGDTIDDAKTRIRYRIANIDAPETQDRAKCYRERVQGNIAKQAAVGIFRRAESIVARPTGRIDPYGRVVAEIEIDGQDFGQMMMIRGFARRWTGSREKWCGPQGGLAKMASVRSHKWSCRKCQHWR